MTDATKERVDTDELRQVWARGETPEFPQFDWLMRELDRLRQENAELKAGNALLEESRRNDGKIILDIDTARENLLSENAALAAYSERLREAAQLACNNRMGELPDKHMELQFALEDLEKALSTPAPDGNAIKGEDQ